MTLAVSKMNVSFQSAIDRHITSTAGGGVSFRGTCEIACSRQEGAASLNSRIQRGIFPVVKIGVLPLLFLASLNVPIKSAAANLALLRTGFLAQVPAPKQPAYPFDRYPAGKLFKGRPAAPQLVTADQRGFRTVLRNGAKKGPNFAGHFTVVQWGCGSNCIAMAVVDAVTGTVYDQDMPQMNESGICGPIFKVTSTLFVVETSPIPNGDCEPELYRWEGSHFEGIPAP